jgi:sugar phosphate isomerase/epimerase
MKIGAQLYTLRDFCKTTEDLALTLKKVADIGYTTVQLSATCEFDAQWMKEQLAANGLKCVVTHVAPVKLQEQLKQVCMLADAILWQSNWIVTDYCSEVVPDIAFEWLAWGFEALSTCAGLVKDRLDSPSATSEEKAAWRELLKELGGEASLELPDKLLQERWAKDYKTALTFYKEFCAAATEKNEEVCLRKLAEQAELLEYFRKGGEMELLRVNALVSAFEEALDTMGDESPFPRPILPKKRRTPARMQALEPFFTAIPALKPLLFDTK